MKFKNTALFIIQALLILLFVYIAATKWVNFWEFKHEMHIQPFGETLKKTLIIGLPVVEAMIGILLIWPGKQRAGFWLTLILMVAFTIYIIMIKVSFFGYIPCSCGGFISSLSWTQHLWLNIGVILLAIWGLFLTARQRTINSSTSPK